MSEPTSFVIGEDVLDPQALLYWKILDPVLRAQTRLGETINFMLPKNALHFCRNKRVVPFTTSRKAQGLGGFGG